MQIARGAVGQCVQKVAEAEALAWAGVRDILVSNEVLCPVKLARLAALSTITRIAVCADSVAGVDAVAKAARDAVRNNLLVENQRGSQSCAAYRPARRQSTSHGPSRHTASVQFGGLQAYHGAAQHLRSPKERANSASLASAHAASLTVQQLAAAGLSCATVSGGGTGTFGV
jgi:D-serine deaminase-like pyridoxal phosphate-dependent protein